MKKAFLFISVVSLIFGCGPKLASQEIMSRLEEAKAACRAAELRAKNLEAERIELEKELLQKQETLDDLKRQLQEAEQE